MADEITQETPVESAPAAAEAVAVDPTPEPEVVSSPAVNTTTVKLVKVMLDYEFNNYNVAGVVGGNQKFGPGEVEVPADIAEDLVRRNEEYNRIERAKHEAIDLTIPLGNINAGGR